MTTRKERRFDSARNDALRLATMLHERGELDHDSLAGVHLAVAAATTKSHLVQSEVLSSLVASGRAAGLVRKAPSFAAVLLVVFLSAFASWMSAVFALGKSAWAIVTIASGFPFLIVAVPVLALFLAAALQSPRLLSPRRRRRALRRIVRREERRRARAESAAREAMALLRFRHGAGEIDMATVAEQEEGVQQDLALAGSTLLVSEI